MAKHSARGARRETLLFPMLQRGESEDIKQREGGGGGPSSSCFVPGQTKSYKCGVKVEKNKSLSV